MKHNMAFLKPYFGKKRWFALGYGALILECVTPIIAVLLQKDLLDQVFIHKHYSAFYPLLILYGLFFFGPKLWFTVRKIAFFRIGYDLQARMNEALYKKIYRLPTAVFRKRPVAKWVAHIRNDVAEVSDLAVNQMLSEWVFVVVTLLLLSITIASHSLLTFIATVVLASVYQVLLHRLSHKTKHYAQRARAERAGISVKTEETISALKEQVAFGRTDWQLKRYENQFDQYFEALVQESRYKIRLLWMSEPFLYGTKLAVIGIGMFSILKYSVSIGAFIVVFTLVDQFITAFGQLFQLSLVGKRLSAPVNALKDIMALEEEQFGEETLVGPIHAIELKNVTYTYEGSDEPILKALTLEIPIGKKIACVGTSGSGKSTLAHLLLRRSRPDAGEVLVNGRHLWLLDGSYSERIGVVLQQPYFLPGTIRENLTMGRPYTETELDQICEVSCCTAFIKTLPQGLDTVVGERGSQLSGGQKQRLALARTLLSNPEILILDEATSALDPETEFKVQSNLDQFRKGKTTIVIAHRLSTIQNADVIVVLDQGRIQALGSHEDLLAKSHTYQSLQVVERVS